MNRYKSSKPDKWVLFGFNNSRNINPVFGYE